VVNYRAADLDRVFATLADPFEIKLPAVMKHLDVLGDAGLITRSKHGRTVEVRLSPAPLRGATEWLRRYERFWSSSLDRLTAHAERKEAETRAAEGKARAKESGR
jgi:DNA-binding transcriptional ArsR family regulator